MESPFVPQPAIDGGKGNHLQFWYHHMTQSTIGMWQGSNLVILLTYILHLHMNLFAYVAYM